MDEDRERHKREKEAKWRVETGVKLGESSEDQENATMNQDSEFNQIYDNLSDFDPERDL